MNLDLLIQSMLLSGAVTLLSVAIGFLAGIVMATSGARLRLGLMLSGIAVLVLPPFLLTNAWLDLAARAGTHGFSLPGTGFVLTTLILAAIYWPLPMFACAAAWRRLEPAMLEADPLVRGRFLLGRVLLPLASGLLIAAAALVFVLALNNFSVPAVLQTKTYPVEIWIRYTTALNPVEAFRTSVPLIIGPILLLLALRHEKISWPHLRGDPSREILRARLGKPLLRLPVFVAICAVAFSVFFPSITILADSATWKALPGAVAAGRASVFYAIIYAAGTSLLCGAFGTALALQRRLALASWLWWIWFLVPGTLLGILLSWLTSSRSFAWLRDSAAIVVFALFLRHLALAWTTSRIAIECSDKTLLDAARIEGAGSWQLFRHVYWPQCSRQMMAGVYAVFLLCLWEVDTVLSLVPPGGDTLSMRAFNLLHYGHTAEINAVCLILLVIALAPLLVEGSLGWFSARTTTRVCLMALIASLLAVVAGCTAGSSRSEVTLSNSSLFERVQVIGSKGAGLGQFNKPRSVAVDAADNLYVADFTGRIQKFSSEGKFLLSWQMPQTDLGKAKGMCRDHAGNIVVVEPHYSRINHFTTNGLLVRQWGTHGTNDGQLAFPRAVAVSPEGRIYVSEYGLRERVQSFALPAAADASPPRLLTTFGSVGNAPGQFNRPEGVGLDEQGQVYVADSCNHRIQVFGAQGAFVAQFGTAGVGPGQLSYPYDVAIDRNGMRYVCEFGNSRIQVFDSNNKPLEILGAPGSAPGMLNNPWSVALDSKGNLYVADSQNHRVQKWIRKG